MARQIEFGQFLIIEASAVEMYVAVGSPGICDFCGEPSNTGYYIAVLNMWFCPECFKQWQESAIYYASDAPIERRNFNRYAERLNVSKC